MFLVDTRMKFFSLISHELSVQFLWKLYQTFCLISSSHIDYRLVFEKIFDDIKNKRSNRSFIRVNSVKFDNIVYSWLIKVNEIYNANDVYK